eukprot:CAMPEP_0115391868 /NCGR_PEP_ID=MMETSP0271-20121206/10932_1 /TAXON_ID=71861 /ORGANISM="Scrippsiella trochoidea, Strain CCMP3099" /LENGTH=694 /DNA_ID=CAMNT_0002815441 /DNA_START=158 /DNA_END=2239 /DNA_ORIENTATION=+
MPPIATPTCSAAFLECIFSSAPEVAALPAEKLRITLLTTGGPLLLGRAQQADFFQAVVPDASLRAHISRSHCSVTWGLGGAQITNLSQNILLVNGVSVPPRQRSPLSDVTELGFCTPVGPLLLLRLTLSRTIPSAGCNGVSTGHPIAESLVCAPEGMVSAAEAAVSEVQQRPLSEPEGANLTFKDLSFVATLPGGGSKTILEPCSGHLPAGELVAIMGPSGCGKSTLLDMLAMKKTAAYDGHVFVNGHLRDPKLFPRIAAYVGQEDDMPGHWKVREALEFNVRLKQQPGASRKEAAELIDQLLDSFGLAGVADTYIGGAQVRGISGGQRRRVTLARGVAAQASLLFCDEPTSGLSATDAELCVRALQDIAKRLNVLTLIVIHQPRKEVAQLFDRLMLLTSNPGRLAYFGTMEEATPYFELCGFAMPAQAANATDYYLDLLTPGTVQDASDVLVEAFAAKQRPGLDAEVQLELGKQGCTAQDMLRMAHENAGGGKAGKLRLGPYAVSFWSQLTMLLRRRVGLTLRNPLGLGVQVGMPIGVGLLLGIVFKGVGARDFCIQTLLFVFVVLVLLSLYGLPLLPTIIDERRIMKLETSERLYMESAHILSTLLVTVPLSLLAAVMEVLIICVLSGLPTEYWPTIFFWACLLFLVFDAVFQLCAAVAADAEQALGLALPFLIVFMLFNGLVVSPTTAPAF